MVSITAVVHAAGPPRSDHVLCGVADDVGFSPRIAAPGLVVTCPDCKEIIAHCQDQFTANYRVRRTSQGEEVR